jgi:hypothetical protein
VGQTYGHYAILLLIIEPSTRRILVNILPREAIQTRTLETLETLDSVNETGPTITRRTVRRTETWDLLGLSQQPDRRLPGL